MGVEHYENFPVASRLCPPAIRPAVLAIYHFARTADDLADEGDASAADRHASLAAYRDALRAAASGRAGPGPWAHVFEPLARAIADHQLPLQPLEDLLDAFDRDADNPTYPDRQALLGYCAMSANPVGRLMLHLLGVHDAEAVVRADAVCSALQLINFWQDLSVDLPRGRIYLPLEELARAGVAPAELALPEVAPRLAPLVRDLCGWSAALMARGAPLARDLPGRAGWELRLVVEGGLRILEKIAAMNHQTCTARPALRALDAPLLLWRALLAPRRRWSP